MYLNTDPVAGSKLQYAKLALMHQKQLCSTCLHTRDPCLFEHGACQSTGDAPAHRNISRLT